MATPCTTTIMIAHQMPSDEDPEIIVTQVEFLHAEGCDPRSEAIDALRTAHDDDAASAADLRGYDIQDHEWRQAQISTVLLGHGLPKLDASLTRYGTSAGMDEADR